MKRASFIISAAGVTFAVMAVGVFLYLGHLSAQRSAINSATSTAPMQIGGSFTLTDQNGVRRTEKDFRGKYMLVFFGYTYCPDVCPTTLAVMAAVLDKLSGRGNQIVPVFISIDPKRDTPEVLKNYLSAFGARFVGLTGSDDEVSGAAKAYRVYHHANPPSDGITYTVDHSSILYLMGPNGSFVSHYTIDVSPEALASDLRKRIPADNVAG